MAIILMVMRSNNMQESIALSARDYQADAVNVVMGKLSQGVARQIVVLPTGCREDCFCQTAVWQL
jgi:superfamily II DNA or RNA helicase